MDTDVHKACTGVGERTILEKLYKALPTGTRTSSSVIPTFRGMNDDQVEKIAELLHRWQQIEAELLPYHKLGNSKDRGAGGTERFEGPFR